MTTELHKYLINNVLPKYQVPQNEIDKLRQTYNDLWQIDLKEIHQYNPRHYFGGSYAKGTMIKGKYDLDFVIYFGSNFKNTPKELSEYVENVLKKKYNTLRYGVATQLSCNGFEIDVVVGKAQDEKFIYSTLWNSKDEKEMRASLTVHIDNVTEVEQVVKILKIWRLNHKLNWHKLAMEQAIVRVLKDKQKNDLGECFKEILLDIKSNIDSVKFLDPANCNNPIFVNDNERKRIKDVATECYNLLITNKYEQIIK